MNKFIALLSLSSLTLSSMGQFAPPAGQPGTTAYAADSSAFVAWATMCEVTRGPQSVSNLALGPATAGGATMATGAAITNGVVSLGDGGIAVLSFEGAITNGPGWDFAVFENSFSETFLELAFVEVSSNGTDFFRFPCTSNTQDTVQIDGFGATDATRLDNLAGKYQGGFGTPFDLEQLSGTEGLDVNAITHVKVIDVVGCIQDAFATYDSNGHKVNDPWSTPFASSGFDLDAVGVINALHVGLQEDADMLTDLRLYPNPTNVGTSAKLRLEYPEAMTVSLFNAQGGTERNWAVPAATASRSLELDLRGVAAGVYFVNVLSANAHATQKLLILDAQ